MTFTYFFGTIRLSGGKMKKNMTVLVLTLMMVTLSIFAETEVKFGTEITITEPTKISQILAKPEDYLNKPVRIEGMVVGVCENKSCWMALASDKEFQQIVVKVNDGEMVFPLTAKGKMAIVEGSLYKLQLTKEQTLKAKESNCKQKGNQIEPCMVKEGEVVYQLKPTAVVIKEK
jgi:hypothetical protein